MSAWLRVSIGWALIVASTLAQGSSAPASDVAAVVKTGCEKLLEKQEGERKAQWPYEGVYRLRGEIPIGYRVGGTAICALALISSPGYRASKDRRAAVARATSFIVKSLDNPLMGFGFNRGYDVRGWGHTYALLYLLRLQEAGLVPQKLQREVKAAIPRLVDVIQKSAIPNAGGWNYARRRKDWLDPAGSASPFMTVPTLQALFLARKHGHRVNAKVVREALDALERGRTDAGGYGYSVPPPGRNLKGSEDQISFMNRYPGSIARTPGVEATLMLAGRGDVGRLRHAIAGFFEHYKEIKARRQKRRTHVRPYGIAPYYFIYAHYYAAQAIEMLPDAQERQEARDRLRGLILDVREKDGTWNGRHFPRSSNYGTAMMLMSLQMKSLPPIPPWSGQGAKTRKTPIKRKI